MKVVKLLLLDILTQINITPHHYDIAEHSIANIRTLRVINFLIQLIQIPHD